MNHNQFLAITTALAAIAGTATAQCSSYSLSPAGTIIIDADDAVREVPLPFAFPFNGNLYNSITVSTNGWIKLGSAVAGGSQLGDSEALMLSDEPRIAVLWDDLNPFASGDLFYSADAFQASITWQGVQRYGTAQAGTLANCECVLTITGEIYLIYDSTCTFNLSNSTSIVGVSAGGNTVAAGTHLADWTTANPGPILVADATGYELFPTGAFDLLGGVTLQFIPTGPSDYIVLQVPTLAACAQLPSYPGLAVGPTSFGTGCPAAVPNSSLYEEFTIDTGANPLDSSNTSMRFLAAGDNFLLIPGPGFDPNYLGGTVLAMTDESVAVVNVGAMGTFPFVDLNVSSVELCSNGFLRLEGTGADYTPSTAEWNAQGARIAGLWKDLNPAAGGTIYINDTDPSFLMITFDAVPEWNSAGSISTFQMKLWANGDIDINHQAVSSITDLVYVGVTRGNAAAGGNSDLVSGGVVNNVGPIDVLGVPNVPVGHTSTQLAFARPWDLSATVGNHNNIGIFIVGFSNPNLPIDFLGAPNCSIYANLDLLFPTVFLGNSFTTSMGVMPYDHSLAGLTLFTQAAAFSNDNALGITTSNGLEHTFGL